MFGFVLLSSPAFKRSNLNKLSVNCLEFCFYGTTKMPVRFIAKMTNQLVGAEVYYYELALIFIR
jgi:hypothetical protein